MKSHELQLISAAGSPSPQGQAFFNLMLKLMAAYLTLPNTSQSNDIDADMGKSIVQHGCTLCGIIAAQLL